MAPIPRFPRFRRLLMGDREVIEAITGQFPPFSDFGFTSLWAWNTDDSCEVSRLGGNLVLRMKDYESDEHFLTFLGQDAVVDAAARLLALTREEGLAAELRLVPETVIAADETIRRCFAVTRDRDNFDYVHDVDALAHFLYPGFREHRRGLARCRERHPLDFELLDVADPTHREAMCAVFHRWSAQKPPLPGVTRRFELAALERVLCLADDDRLAAGGFFDRGRLVGFSIWEGLPGGEHAVLHFQKADQEYRGLSSWQIQAVARALAERGFRWINLQQDLGIPGLRTFKRSLQPCRFLRKYVVAERGDGEDEADGEPPLVGEHPALGRGEYRLFRGAR